MIARATVGDVLFAAVGVGGGLLGWKLGIGSISAPEAGLMPFTVGCLLALLALSGILSPRVRRADAQQVGSLPPLFGNPSGWVFAVVATIGFVMLVKYVAFTPAVFLYVFLLHGAGRPRRLFVSLIYAALVTAAAWAVFVRWLGVSFS